MFFSELIQFGEDGLSSWANSHIKLCNSRTRQWLELERCPNHLRIRQDI